MNVGGNTKEAQNHITILRLLVLWSFSLKPPWHFRELYLSVDTRLVRWHTQQIDRCNFSKKESALSNAKSSPWCSPLQKWTILIPNTCSFCKSDPTKVEDIIEGYTLISPSVMPPPLLHPRTLENKCTQFKSPSLLSHFPFHKSWVLKSK